MLRASLWKILRPLASAIWTPIRFSTVTGHWRSSIAQQAMTQRGDPLPWYTYSAIDFLAQRSFQGLRVLEFGGGQSTLWWAKRASSVLTVEENEAWFNSLKKHQPANVSLHHIPVDQATRSIAEVRRLIELSKDAKYDVIIVDGHLRKELAEMAFDFLAPNGALLLDNSEGYGFHDVVGQRNCRRVDFFGFAPGVSKRHCTSLVYVGDCFLLKADIPIASIERV